MTPTVSWKPAVSRGEIRKKNSGPTHIKRQIFYSKHQSALFHYDQSCGAAGSSELLEKLKLVFPLACFPPPWPVSCCLRCVLAGAGDIHQSSIVPVGFAHRGIYNAITMFALAQNYTTGSIEWIINYPKDCARILYMCVCVFLM